MSTTTAGRPRALSYPAGDRVLTRAPAGSRERIAAHNHSDEPSATADAPVSHQKTIWKARSIPPVSDCPRITENSAPPCSSNNACTTAWLA